MIKDATTYTIQLSFQILLRRNLCVVLGVVYNILNDRWWLVDVKIYKATQLINDCQKGHIFSLSVFQTENVH